MSDRLHRDVLGLLCPELLSGDWLNAREPAQLSRGRT